jgi:hypothetical protein
VAALVLIGALVCALSVATERGFYYWDFAAYQNDTLNAVGALRGMLAHGGSFRPPVFAVPLIPWVLLLGDSRLVFVLAVYFTYFVPYVLLAGTIAKRAWPERADTAAVAVVAAALLTPAAWSHVLQGYPDISGAALMAASVLCAARWDATRRFLVPVTIGLLAGLSVVLRRHYVYAVAALYVAILLDGVGCWLNPRQQEPARPSLSALLLGLAVSGITAVGLIAVLNRQFFAMALNTMRGEMAPYEQTVGATLISTLATVGVIPLLLAGLGWLWLWRKPAPWPPEVRLVALSTIAWVVIWAGRARQQPYHYPHWVPLFVILGHVWLWANLTERNSRWTRSAVLGVLAVGFVVSMPILAAPLPNPPLRMFADPIRRSSNPAYASIVDLVYTLRRLTPEREGILIAASSLVLNVDVVRSAEIAVYGRENAKLNVLASPQVDSEPPPTDMLLRAQVVVVAEPFQHHLAPEYQKVVSVLVEAFRAEWPVSRDFELVPPAFPLPEAGGEIRVYRRNQASSAEVAADTFGRIETYLLGHMQEGSIWLVRSDFPSQVTREADGSVRVIAHPARASTRSPTRVTLSGAPPSTGEVSANLSFYDTRCEGVQIVALAGDGERSEEVSLGTYTPTGSNAALRGRVPVLGGRPLALEIRSTPERPENIEYCTVALSSLKVVPAPENPPPVQ